jgi:hypothetical protein
MKIDMALSVVFVALVSGKNFNYCFQDELLILSFPNSRTTSYTQHLIFTFLNCLLALYLTSRCMEYSKLYFNYL